MIPGSANSLLMRPADAAAASEVVTKSCRFDGSSYLSQATGSTATTWTMAFWVKRAKLGTHQYALSFSESPSMMWGFAADDTLIFYALGTAYTSTSVYRDTGAWMHVAIVCTSGSADFYINGTQVTDGSFSSSLSCGEVESLKIGLHSLYYYNGYMADFYFVEGSAVTPKNNFTNNPANDANGQLKPKAYTSSLGTNGFHLEFLQDGVGTGSSSTIGADTGGGDNHFDSSGIAASDQMEDRPTNNYAVLNPLSLGSGGTLAEGNLELATSSSGYANCYSTIAMGEANDTKKYYAEFYVTVASEAIIGMATLAAYDTAHVGNNDESWGYYQDGALRWGSWSTPGSNDTYLNGEIIGVMYDASANTITFYNEGVAQTYGFSSTQDLDTKKPLVFAMSDASGSGTAGVVANYGQDPTFAGNKTSGQDTSQSEFYYAPPTGAVALSTANLPDPTIADGTDHFDTLLYTGDGNKTGLDFTPDLTWIKNRDSDYSHVVGDVIRGDNNFLATNSTGAEGTDSTKFKSFVTGGIDVGDHDGTGNSSDDYVAWNWKGGSTHSHENYNATAGFSIIKWTGDDDSMADSSQTVSHTLGATPDFIIAKNRTNNASGTGSWIVYHKDLPAGDFLKLDDNAAKFTPETSLISSIGIGTVAFASDAQGLSPTNEYLNFGGEVDVSDADTYIAYLFSEVGGYSKFGSYEGNTDADGPFVWCGFRPAMVMIKTTSSDRWVISDAGRNPYNVVTGELNPNDSATEDTSSTPFDFLSNGFKLRRAGNVFNATGRDYIFAAFAEKPLKYATAR